jgi:hypothetical protein
MIESRVDERNAMCAIDGFFEVNAHLSDNQKPQHNDEQSLPQINGLTALLTLFALSD